MTRKVMLLSLLLVGGCHVTTGVYVEKDYWHNSLSSNPDLRTKVKIEVSKDL